MSDVVFNGTVAALMSLGNKNFLMPLSSHGTTVAPEALVDVTRNLTVIDLHRSRQPVIELAGKSC